MLLHCSDVGDKLVGHLSVICATVDRLWCCKVCPHPDLVFQPHYFSTVLIFHEKVVVVFQVLDLVASQIA